jgi:hypothetical protein
MWLFFCGVVEREETRRKLDVSATKPIASEVNGLAWCWRW